MSLKFEVLAVLFQCREYYFSSLQSAPLCACLQLKHDRAKLPSAKELPVAMRRLRFVHGVQEVAGSNPVAPTRRDKKPFGQQVEGLSHLWD
jgi:hypothetical protein